MREFKLKDIKDLKFYAKMQDGEYHLLEPTSIDASSDTKEKLMCPMVERIDKHIARHPLSKGNVDINSISISYVESDGTGGKELKLGYDYTVSFGCDWVDINIVNNYGKDLVIFYKYKPDEANVKYIKLDSKSKEAIETAKHYQKLVEETIMNKSVSIDYNKMIFDDYFKICTEPDRIKSVNVIVPEKVMEVHFYDGQKVKVVCDKEDTFDLERGLYIAIAKKLYKETHTEYGIEQEAYHLTFFKLYEKYVKEGVKLYHKDLEEKQKKLAEEERIKRYKEKRKAYKARRNERRRNEKIDLIAEAIKKSKEV